MRKRLVCIALMLVMVCMVGGEDTVSAELVTGVQIGYGSTTYSKVLGEDGIKATEWLSNVGVEYTNKELLLTGSYQGALGLQDVNIGRHLAQVGANYRFLEDGPLKVYGGLGYQLLSTRFNLPEYEDGEKFSLTGHGFSAQAVVGIDIIPEFRASATLSLAPWMNWAYSSGGNSTSNINSSSAFNSKLDLVYDFSEEFGVQLSVSGGTYSVPEFTKGETRASYSAINLGVTRNF